MIASHLYCFKIWDSMCWDWKRACWRKVIKSAAWNLCQRAKGFLKVNFHISYKNNFLVNNSLDIKMTLYKIWKTFYDDLCHQEKNFWNFHLVFWINSIKRQKCFASIFMFCSKNVDEPQVNFVQICCFLSIVHTYWITNIFHSKWIINFQFFFF